MAVLRLPPLSTTRDLLKLYKLTATKSLSQNFLLNEQLTDKIIRKAGNLSACHVLEIGPGPGGLTRSIMRKCPKHLTVIEKDKRFQPILEMLAESFSAINGKMDIIYDDIMKIKMENLFPESEKKRWDEGKPNIHLVGNLPFNVSTPLIIQWLHAISEQSGPWALGRCRMTLTFQKEVAERLVAQPHGDQRCRLSVMAQAWTFPIMHFIIPGKAFVPRPKVDVGVVTFAPLVVPRTKHEFKLFEKVTRHIFSFRQKYSIRGAETLFPLECRKELGKEMYELSDIDPKTKSTQLTVEDFDKLVSSYKHLVEKHPEIGNYVYRTSRKILSKSLTKRIEIEALTDIEDTEMEEYGY